jgi:Cu-Zn family superoxide dismutase
MQKLKKLIVVFALFGCAKPPMKSVDNRNSESTPGKNDQDATQIASSLGVDQNTANQYLALVNESFLQNPGTLESRAKIVSRSGSKVLGQVSFRDLRDGSGMVATYIVVGLNPGQEHGFHIHDVGNCESSDGLSTAGHFNPDKKDHGGPAAEPHHAGDMGNIKANELGIAWKRILIKGVTVAKVKGKGLIVHQNKDDFTNVNNGNAGARWGCGVIAPGAEQVPTPEPTVLAATLISLAAKTPPVKGRLELRDLPGGGVSIKGTVEGLTPNMKHAIHIHENPANSECVNTFTEVGGHYNPTTQPHGKVGDSASHGGDLGNLEVDEAGKATVNITKMGISLKGTNPVAKRAIIIHDKQDDFTTQPTGNAGDRISCGIIK